MSDFKLLLIILSKTFRIVAFVFLFFDLWSAISSAVLAKK
tara:strand:+ start:241 stop:360 length:120 start_codon:yes stop_codon:yes gene_type:complete